MWTIRDDAFERLSAVLWSEKRSCCLPGFFSKNMSGLDEETFLDAIQQETFADIYDGKRQQNDTINKES